MPTSEKPPASVHLRMRLLSSSATQNKPLGSPSMATLAGPRFTDDGVLPPPPPAPPLDADVEVEVADVEVAAEPGERVLGPQPTSPTAPRRAARCARRVTLGI